MIKKIKKFKNKKNKKNIFLIILKNKNYLINARLMKTLFPKYNFPTLNLVFILG